jgi:hypothetical protein
MLDNADKALPGCSHYLASLVLEKDFTISFSLNILIATRRPQPSPFHRRRANFSLSNVIAAGDPSEQGSEY